MKTTVGNIRKLVKEAARPKPEMLDVIDAIKNGLYNHEELKSINSYVQDAVRKKQASDEVQKHKGGLGDLESHKNLLSDMMSEWWDDHQETAFVESLLALSGGQVYGPEDKDDAISAAISDIVSTAGSASNDRDEMQNTSDEDDEYGELETSFEDNYSEAMKQLEAFWTKYVEKKAPAPKAKKSTKKGK